MRTKSMVALAATLLVAVLAGPASAAEGNISLNLRDAKLVQVLDLMAQQVKYQYVMMNGVRGDTPVTISISNKPFDEALKLVLSTAGANFEVTGDIYYIKPEGAVGAGGAAQPVTPTPTTGGFTANVPTRPTSPPRPTTTRRTTQATNPYGVAPAYGAGLGGTAADAPNATTSAKGVMQVIPLKYADAPSIAMLFYNQTTGIMGRPLYYSDLNRWSSGGGNNSWGGNNNSWGGNNNSWGGNNNSWGGNNNSWGNNNNSWGGNNNNSWGGNNRNNNRNW